MAAREQAVVAVRPERASGPGASRTAVDPGPPPGRPSVELMGVRVDRVDGREAIDRIMSSIEAGVGGWVITPNVDILRRIVSDPAFARLAASADLSIADGMPLVWASRLQGTSLPARVAASELVFPLTREAARLEYSLFLLGGASGTAQETAFALLDHAPAASIVGTYAPPVGFEHDEEELLRIIRMLRDSAPDIVLCAFGCPKQERLMVELRQWLPAHLVHRRGRVLHDGVRPHPGGPAVDAAFGTRVAPPSSAGAPTPVPPLHRPRPPLRSAPAGHERARGPPLAA